MGYSAKFGNAHWAIAPHQLPERSSTQQVFKSFVIFFKGTVMIKIRAIKTVITRTYTTKGLNAWQFFLQK
jgi:hypothetical protein